MLKVSAILPAYNVADTLQRCVESVAAQNVPDIEVIIVDDGSTDNTPQIADRLSAEYSFLRVIHRPNGGLSAARNTGMAAATGDILTFVDTDDELLPDIYRQTLAMMEDDKEADILEFAVRRELPGGKIHIVKMPSGPSDDAINYWLQGAYTHSYACNKLFRRRLLYDGDRLKVAFPEGRTFEDVVFMGQVIMLQPRIIFCPVVGYLYRYNAAGISQTAQAAQYRQLMEAHLDICRRLQLFSSDTLTGFEATYYAHLLNQQITLRRLGDKEILLPARRVALAAMCSLPSVSLLKIALTNLLGLPSFLRVFCK